jgi:hypothetical protein
VYYRQYGTKTHFQAKRGVQQGDVGLPTIFNVIVDAVIGATEEELKDEDTATLLFKQMMDL